MACGTRKMMDVSNPWREAIEGILIALAVSAEHVSNPWREAIEDNNW